jgi:acetylglutamate kinase
MEQLHIIKIGGNCIDDSHELELFLSNFAAITGPKILIHGGGKMATQLATKLGTKQTMVDGRRITDAQTLDIAVMVYAGLINKSIVAQLQARNCNAIGFSGADGNLIQSVKRPNQLIDFGFVGDILDDGINIRLFETFLQNGIIPVVSPITHDGNGQLLNTNADTIASKIAIALSLQYHVILTYCFEKTGVLYALENEESYLPILTKEKFTQLKVEGIISKGMLTKLDNAFAAIEQGVTQVTICNAQHLSSIGSKQIIGTQIINEWNS